MRILLTAIPYFYRFLVAFALLALGFEPAFAQISKNGSVGALNLGAQWVGGTAPGTTDTAAWDINATGGGSTPLGANTTWAAITYAPPAAWTISSGNTLTVPGAVSTTAGIDFTGATTNFTINCALTLNGPLLGNNASGVTLALGSVLTLPTPISSGGTFNGTVMLLGANTNLLNRTAAGSFGSQFGTSATIFIGPGVTLQPFWTTGTAAMTLENPLILSNGIVYLNSGASSGTTLPVSGTVTLSAGTTNFFRSDYNDKNYTFTGQISGSGNLVFNGPIPAPNPGQTNTFTNPANNYTGFTQIETTTANASQTTLVLGVNNGVPATSDVIIGDGTAGHGGVFDLHGFSDTVNSISTPSSSTSGKITDATATASTLTIGDGGGQTYSALLSGPLAIVKNGTGTQNLGATAQTYTGATTINAGTLALKSGASINSTPSINVGFGAIFDVSAISYTMAAGQALLGKGVVKGSVTTTASAPTNSIFPGADGTSGTLSFSNNLTMTAGSTFNYDLGVTAAGANDLVVVAGTVTGNNTVFKIKAPFGFGLDTNDYTLIVSSNAIAGTWASQPTFIVAPTNNAANYFVVVGGNTVRLSLLPPTKLVVTLPGQTFTSGVGNSGTVTTQFCGTPFNVTVTGTSASNVTATNMSGTKTITLTGPSGTFTYSGTANFTNGVATISVKINSPQTAVLTVTDPTDGGVSGVSANLPVIVGPVAQLIWATQPGSGIAGLPFCTQPVLETADAAGNFTTNNLFPTVNVVVSLTSGSGTLSGTTNYNIGTAGANGVVNFTNLSLNAVGSNYQLTAAVVYSSSPAPGAVIWLDASTTNQSTLTVDGNGGISGWNNLGTRGGTLGIAAPGINGAWTGPTNVLNSMNGLPVAKFSSTSTGQTAPGNVLTNSWAGLVSGPDIHLFTVTRHPANPLNNWPGFIGFGNTGGAAGKIDNSLGEDAGWSTNGFRFFRNDTGSASPAYSAPGQFSTNNFANGIGFNFNETGLSAWLNKRPANNVAFVNSFYFQGSINGGADYWVDASANTWTNFQTSTHIYPNFAVTDFGLGAQLGAAGGSPLDAPDWPINVDFGEVLVYTNILNATDRATVQNYLQGKWLATVTTNAVTIIFSVTTNTPPGITCPANITVNTATGQCSSNVTFSVSATNNCGAAVSVVSVPASGSAFNVGTTTVTNTATDSSGSSNTCTFTVTVLDKQPPVITCPASLTVNAALGQCSSNVTFSATATDNCGGAVTNIVSAPASGSAFPVGTTTVTNIATDASGNTNSCTFTVTVVDNQPPTITCPANMTVSATLGACSTNVSFIVTATDNCGTVTNITSLPASGSAFNVGTTTVTSTAVDSHNNTNTCSFTVKVVDNQPPVFTSCPTNMTVILTNGCTTNVTFSATATDNCGVPTVTSTPVSGFAFPIGTTTVTNVAKDSSNNTNVCTFTVTVIDSVPPVISCPGNITKVLAAGTCTTNITYHPTATDNCGTPTIVSVPASGFAFPVGTTTVTNTATDSGGNTAVCTFKVIVQDTQPPTFTTCPANMTVNTAPGSCTTNVNFTVIATDNCTVTNQTSNPTNGFAFPIGTTTVTTIAKDSSGNSASCIFTVTVVDNQAPLFTACPSSLTVNAAPGSCTSNVTFTVSATDNCGTPTITSTPVSGFAFPIGTTTVTNVAKDSAGNSNVCSFTVTVIDNQPPSITCPTNVTVIPDAGTNVATNVTLGTPTTSDNCGTVTLSSNAPAFYPIGTNTVTWTAVDLHNNTNTCQQLVIVGSLVPPSITCPADFTVNAALGTCAATNVSLGTPSVTSSCGSFTLSSNTPASFTVGTNNVIWKAVDQCGNSNSCVQHVIVRDITPPTIATNADLNVFADLNQCATTNVTLTTPATSDNCTFVTVTNNAPTNYLVGTNLVTWTATDANGNTNSSIQRVIVRDNQPPTISCPGTVTVLAAGGSCYATNVVLGTPIYSDNCPGVTVTNDAPTQFPVGPTLVTWTATDASGNTQTCQQLVFVQDTQPPNISCPFDEVLIADPGACSAGNLDLGTAIASDNCGVVVSLTNNAPSTLPVGTNIVTWTALDASGNSNTCQQTVIILDTEPPVITCPANRTVNTAPGQCTTNVAFTVTATDNCSGPVTITSTPTNGFAFPIGITTVTNTAVDGNGNTNVCTFTITVVDNQAPTFTLCPANLTVNTAPGSCTSNVTFTVTATDNCGTPTITSTPVSGFAFPIGITTVTNIAKDASGNSNTCSFTVTVVDNQAPTFTLCPANRTVNTAPGSCTSNVTFVVTATDNCGTPTITSTPTNGFAFPIGITTVTNIAKDASGNSNICTFTVTVVDNQAPTFTLCPANLTVNAALGQCTSNVTFTVTATDNCGTPTITSTPVSGFAFPIGTTTVTNIAKDSSGNSNVCSFTVKVVDNQPPFIATNADLNVFADLHECATTNVTLTTPAASDNCGFVSVTNNAPTNYVVGTNLVTWTATDANGNTNSSIQRVIVRDNQPPTISCPGTVTVPAANGFCYATNVVLGSPVVTDNCPGVTVSNDAPTQFSVGPNLVTWTATDAGGNKQTCQQFVFVLDTQPPSITCPLDEVIPANAGTCSVTNLDLGTAHATDNCLVISLTNNAPSSLSVGTNIVTWTAIDASGNSNSCQQTVIILDTEPPVFTLCPANRTVNTAPGSCTSNVTFVVTATDNCSTPTITSTPVSGFAFPIGITTVTNIAKDASGNSNVCTFSVTVVDNQAPVFTACPADLTVNTAPGSCTSNVTFTVTATDNCGTPTITSTPVSGFAFPIGITTVTNIAKDASGNSNVCSFTITVQDKQPPTFTACPANLTVNTAPGSCTSNVTFVVSATDNCGTPTITSTPVSGFAFPIGITTVTNIAKDASGNSNVCTFTVTVVDNQAPTFTLCPASLTVNAASGQCTSNVTFVVSATDNCGTPTITSTPVSGFAFPVGITTVTNIAKDASGNSNVCTFNVTVIDNQLPTIICPADVSATPDAGTNVATHVTLGSPVATDNCGTPTVTSNAPAFYPLGTNLVTWTAVDAHNNTNTCVQRVIVGTTQPPTISCPVNVTVNAPLGSCVVSNVSLGTPTSTSSCGTNTISNNAPASYGIGTNFVTWTAKDECGNPASCLQQVIVRDITPPVITCSTNITVNAAPGQCTSNVTFTVSAVDGCGTVTNLTSSPTNGFAFPIGTNTVTTTAVDNSGNTNTCTFTVTVQDKQAPTFTLCPANLTVNTAPGSCTSNVTFVVSATDNCGTPTITSTPVSGFAFPIGTTSVTNIAKDASGNSNVCTFTITVVDNQPPTFTACPANLTVNTAPGSCTSNVTFVVTATDNCGTPTITSTPVSGFAFPIGTTTVTNIAKDSNGNSNTCSFTVTVVDNQPPTFTACPASLTVNTAPGSCTSNVTFVVSATDNCGTPTITSTPVSGFAFPIGITTVTNVAKDASGNSNVCSFTVTVVDNQAPVFTLCPANLTVNTAPGSCTSNVTFTVTATDNCGTPTITSTPVSGFAFPIGITTVTNVAKDASGNSNVCSFTITVVDNQAPVFTACPANLTVNTAPGSCTSNVTFTVTATDNCGTPTITSTPVSGFAFPIGITTVTNIAKDASGNSNVCTFSVTVVDNQAPVFTLCPANRTVNAALGSCTSNVTFVVTATDNCGTPTITSTPVSGFAFPIGTTTVTNIAKDASGNSNVCSFTVTVIDNQLPNISCPADVSVTPDAGTNVATHVTLGSPVATDNCGTPTVTSNAPAFYPLGTNLVTWTAVDAHNNTNTCVQRVIVGTTQPPTISCPANITVNAPLGSCVASNVSLGTPITTSSCGTNTVSNNAPASFPVGTNTVTWTAVDQCGNPASCLQQVIVRDITPPAMTCPASLTVNAAPGSCASNVNFFVIATDACGSVTNLSSSVPTNGYAFPVGLTTVTNIAVDNSGNTNICTFTVKVIDNQLPTIATNTDVIVVAALNSCFATNVTLVVPAATDNCTFVTVTSNATTNYPVGTNTVTWTATDGSGNTNFSLQHVIVRDVQVPTITCPTDLTVNASASSCFATNVVLSIPAVASDNCTFVTVTSNAPPTYSVGTNFVIWTATDGSGNSNSCLQQVIVRDITPPTFTLCPASVTVNAAPGQCTSNVTFVVTATDNCGAATITSVPPSGFAFPIGITTVTNTAKDASSNATVCTFTVTVIDNQPPTISCPASLTVNAAPGQCTSNVTFSVTGTDNCGTPTITSTPVSGFAFPVGSTIVTNVALDAHGNSNTCTFTITVIDNQLPSIACPANVTVAPDAGTNVATHVTLGTPTASDNCGAPTVTSNAPAFYPLGTNTVTWTAVDSHNNTNTCQQLVVVGTSVPPSISCPADLTVNAALGTCAATNVILGTPSATSSCGSATFSSNTPASYIVGTNLVTWTAVDQCDNSNSCIQHVIVRDITPPVFTLCPANRTVNTALGSCTSNVTFTVTAVDGCGTVTNLTSSPASGFAFPIGNTTVNSIAVDNSGNTNTCSFIVTVVDNQAPTFTLCPASVTVNAALGGCTSNVTFTVSATDNCGTPTITSTPASGFAFPVGSTTVTNVAKDASGNSNVCTFTVTVIDNQKPTISCPANVSVTPDAGTNVASAANVTLGTPTASDNCGAVTVTSNAPAFYPLGTNTVTWTAVDTHNNTNTCQQLVVVGTSVPPVINCPADLTVNAALGTCAATNVILGTPSVTSSCGSATTSSNTPASFTVGTNLVTWKAVDQCGNSNTCIQRVIVRDITPPVFTLCPASLTVNTAPGSCTSNVTFTVTAVDGCGTVTNQSSSPASGFAFPIGNTTVNSIAVDNSGNTNTCSFTVTVVDNQAPTFTLCPANVTVNAALGGCTSNVTFTVSATDNCGTPTITSTPVSGFAFPVGSTTVTNVAKDTSGNSNVCTFIVTVIDNQKPSITCPTNVSVLPDAGTNVATHVTLGSPTASDNCGAVTISSNAPAFYPLGTNTVTWTAVDTHNNTNTCQQLVIVGTTQPPIISCPPNVVTNAALGTCSVTNVILGTPSVTSSCGSVTLSNDAPVVYNVGLTKVTWTATDQCGNASQCVQHVTVQHITPPVITCPANVTVNTTPNQCTAGYNFFVSAVDDCGTITSLTSSVPTNGYVFPAGLTTVTNVAVNNVGSTNTCTFTVTVVDKQPPTIATNTDVIVVAALGSCFATNVSLAAPAASDNCTFVTVTNNAPTNYAVGTNTVTWTATDGSGNTNFSLQHVIVRDVQVPVITCPTDLTVNSSASSCFATSVVLTPPSASDNCTFVTITSNTPPFYAVGTNSVIWTAIDGSGNSNSCLQHVIVRDITPPTFTLCPTNITVNAAPGQCTSNVTFIVTATDNCGAPTITSVPASGFPFPVGVNPVTSTAKDASGNTNVCSFTITVIDNQLPTIACPANLTVAPDAGTNVATHITLGTTTASDNCGPPTVTSNAPAVFPLGTNVVTWTVVDAHNNTNTCQQLVIVGTTVPPVINCPADVTVNATLGTCTATSVNLGTPSVTSSCGSITLSSNTPPSFTVGTNLVTWKAVDQCGNSNSCTQRVIVRDITPPVVTCPANITVVAPTNSCSTIVNFNVSASDGCGPVNLSVTPPSGSAFQVGVTPVTTTATDAAGNTNSCTFTVTVKDLQAPTIICPPDIRTNAPPAGNAVTNIFLGTPVTSDNCTVAIVTNNMPAPAIYPIGTNLVTWTVVDASGNTNFCIQRVVVVQTCSGLLNITSLTNQTVCPCDIVVFTTTATTGDPVQFAWQFNGQPIAGESTNSLILASLSQTNSGTYTVIVNTPCRTNTSSASLVVLPGGTGNPASYTNAVSITIPAKGDATPYPAPINVQCVPGAVTNVTVSLNGFGHTAPSNVRVLLVNPQGKGIKLMSKAGDSQSVANIGMLFSGLATNLLPITTAITNGLYLPTDFGGSTELFDAPAPAPPYLTDMSNFSSVSSANPNGVWNLYVLDGVTNNAGSINGGWTLNFQWASPSGPDMWVNPTLTNGLFTAQLQGAAGIMHVIEGSSDFTNWVPLLSTTNGATIIIDTQTHLFPYRFFRSVHSGCH